MIVTRQAITIHEQIEEPARFHPLADLFPMLVGEPFSDLVEDIRQHGLREPIVMFDGQILDGRNRYCAAREAGKPWATVDYDGDDPLGFVVSLNLKRRHLNESQRAMAASKIAKLPKGANQHTAIAAPSQGEAAAILNVSVDSIQRAAIVRELGAPELVKAVESGEVAVSAAAEIARLPEPEQREIVARGEKEIVAAYKQLRADKIESSRKARVEKIIETSRANAPLATDVRYPVIYADPPWQYENPPIGATNRAIENHYPTMTLDEIKGLPVSDLATEDAVLFLWATAPKLAECMEVIDAWGFTYRTCMVWVKDKIGMGYHVRNQHEILLIAKRGGIPPPPPEARPSSVLQAPRTEHSAKPLAFVELIGAMYPDLPKIELFCRDPQPGWAVWGNQAEAA